ALAEVCLLATSRGHPPVRIVAGLIASVATVAVVLGYGLSTLRLAPERSFPATRVVVAQANLDLGSQWRQELYGRNLEDYMRLTLAASARGSPALVVWP